MHWQRLDRDTSVKVIDSVKSDANEGMFSIGTSEVQRARVSFYREYFIYKVTNYASLPSFTFEYLSDGTFFHYLDGTEAPIYAVNDKGGLTLDPNNVIDYASFYYERAGDEDGDVLMIKNPSDMPLLDSLDPRAYDAVFDKHINPQITLGDNGNYFIEANLYKDTQLIRAQMEVTPKGRLKIINQKMIPLGMISPEESSVMM